MKLYQIDWTIEMHQDDIDLINEELQSEYIPIQDKMDLIREREEIKAEISSLIETKAILQTLLGNLVVSPDEENDDTFMTTNEVVLRKQ